MDNQKKVTPINNGTPAVSITVDDGSIAVPVRNKHGDEIGVFRFQPTDIGIIERYNQTVSDLEHITEPLESVNIQSDGTVDEHDNGQLTALKEAETRLYKACDYLFGGNMSEAFFGKMHPFSPVGGRFYCEIALEAVGQFISRQFDRETKKIESRVNRYTHGYRTGKHKDGKN